MNITLKIWRQNGPKDRGAMHEYKVNGVSEDSSFLEMLDILNEEHEMQFEVFSAMEKRGWYTPQPAESKKQQQACKQFTQMEKQL